MLVGIRPVLSQIQGNLVKVIAYASRSLTSSEKNYCVTQSCSQLGILLNTFTINCWEESSTIRIESQALKWLCGFKELEGEIARWPEILAQY